MYTKMRGDDLRKAAVKLARTLRDAPIDDEDFIVAVFKAGFNHCDRQGWTEISGTDGFPALNTTVLVEFRKGNALGTFDIAYACAFWDGERWRIDDGMSMRHEAITYPIIRWMAFPKRPFSSLPRQSF